MIKLGPIPRSVVIALGFLGFSAVGLVLVQFLLAADVTALRASNSTLESDIARVRTDTANLGVDKDFVTANTERFETVLSGDLLIPHSRRTALRMIQDYALALGINSLNYEFQTISSGREAAAARQVDDSEYRVNVEEVKLSVGAPSDRAIFLFIEELVEDIPGTAIVKDVAISRLELISTEVLNELSAGQSTGIVTGDIVFEWRTAQRAVDE